jgi:hypothetical protein
MATEREPLPDVVGWEALLLQMIAFPAQSLPPDFASAWTEFTGEEPESTIRKKGVQLEEKGVYHDAMLTITTDLLRTACAASPRVDFQEVPSQLPTLGEFADANGWFGDLITQWLDRRRPSIKRLAFNATLVRYTDNRDAVYHLLGRYLHAVKVTPASSDLLYRINRRRPGEVVPGGLWINRLSTWSSVKFTIQAQGVTQSGEPIPAFTTSEQNACRLELDINTDQDYSQTLAPDHLPQLFRELVSLGTEIAERGDVE